MAILSEMYGRSVDLAIKLDDALEKLLQNLAQFKDFCPSCVKRPLFRKCVILRRYSLIYRHYEEMIWIVDVLDNREQSKY